MVDFSHTEAGLGIFPKCYNFSHWNISFIETKIFFVHRECTEANEISQNNNGIKIPPDDENINKITDDENTNKITDDGNSSSKLNFKLFQVNAAVFIIFVALYISIVISCSE